MNDSSTALKDAIALEDSNIIVCGRGKNIDLLPGNVTFRKVISEYASQYAGFRKCRRKKSILIRWIASHFQERRMVFVKRSEVGDRIDRNGNPF
jgi:hypothetical protein